MSTTERKNISYRDYESIFEIFSITEFVLSQINTSREIICNDNSEYGKAFKDGKYITDNSSKWQVFDVEKTGSDIKRVIYWNESDDGSFSVHFEKDSLEPSFYCYEN